MKSRLIAGLTLAAISAVVSTTAFAEGGQGIGRAGTYQVQTTTAQSTGVTKTRAKCAPNSRPPIRTARCRR